VRKKEKVLRLAIKKEEGPERGETDKLKHRGTKPKSHSESNSEAKKERGTDGPQAGRTHAQPDW
jgi:hypothetical protein